MKTVESYLKVYEILDEYYFSDKDNLYDMASMLSDMDTHIWKPGPGEEIVSGDPSIFEEMWTDAWNKIVGKDKDATDEQVYQVAKVLLDYYSEQVEYDLGDSWGHLREKLGLEPL